MQKRIFIIATFFFLSLTLPVMASQGHSGSVHGDSGMQHDSTDTGFKHQEGVEGIRAEFQVMSLASMKMDDPDGNTHHIMVKFVNEKMDHQIEKAVGKIKIITPDKKEQTNALKNYGGILAANFTFADKGKYGVICLFKVDGKKHVVKFWYPHHS